jgi:hypothetical protein
MIKRGERILSAVRVRAVRPAVATPRPHGVPLYLLLGEQFHDHCHRDAAAACVTGRGGKAGGLARFPLFRGVLAARWALASACILRFPL